jgi:hypothetical protein
MQPDQQCNQISALFTASVRSTAKFDRLLRRMVRDILLPRTLEEAILASNPPGIRGMSDKTPPAVSGKAVLAGCPQGCGRVAYR